MPISRNSKKIYGGFPHIPFRPLLFEELKDIINVILVSSYQEKKFKKSPGGIVLKK